MSGALLPKPQMRGLLAKRLRRHAVLGIVFCLGVASMYKFGVAEPRKRAYKDFYKNYDAMKEFEAMAKTGVFESTQIK
ncbi:Cytochrome c oxidase subunit 6C-2 [Varanus komodoensis]|uniref:Cytochrome c oxidase subunit 6C n=1 Tax=Varanus komodoensis TaxID=61221 RepID=A0A8D2L2W5_VARKO|nr:cytochrome c oxidase subunit 6C-2 [Varanus komodoensis]XP_044278078.1 cytochrome c oxidase subunit 6C-2 [Varanus komodoensis]KAF7246981.1 Cytochrome c oxidase subunit 6C-2 [Varanus komodoensis]